MKKENEIIKGKVIRDIRNLVEQEEDYYKPARTGNFLSKIILNMKVMVIEMKHYQLKNVNFTINKTILKRYQK